MSLNPTKNRVVIRPIIKDDKTDSGIIIPGKEKRNSDYAIVEAIGNGVDNLKVGDKVVYNDNGKSIVYDGENYIILNQDDILAIVM
ncbi:MAG: co-chaperone GroES [Clostridia bacterium]|nr:co-chaperone GroES [Clostridia bacterium]